MFPRGSACVYTVHMVKTSIGNYFDKTRQLVMMIDDDDVLI